MPKIYTKTGDKGETSMLGGKRVSKSCLEMEAIGEVDELNAFLGMLIEELEDFEQEKNKLTDIQHQLFIIGSNLAALQASLIKIPKLKKIEITKLENWIDKMDKELPELKNFILPGGCEEASLAFYARAICRRAERRMIGLSEKYNNLPRSERSSTTGVPDNIKQYLNRLSDLLFVLGRWLNFKNGVKEVKWKY